MGDDSTPFQMLEKAHVLTSPDGLTGQAYTYAKERFNPGSGEIIEESDYDVAYNENNLRRSDDGGITWVDKTGDLADALGSPANWSGWTNGATGNSIVRAFEY